MTTDDSITRKPDEIPIDYLHEMEILREKTKNYSSAAQGIDGVMHQISSVSESLVTLSGRLSEMIETLRHVGTPELLADIKNLRNEVQTLKQQTDTHFKIMASYQRRGFIAKLFGK
jgi:hypothetical protein